MTTLTLAAMTAALRLAVTVVILALLGRSAWLAWANRQLALAVWRRIRLAHVAGSLALLLLVGTVAVMLAVLVPLTGVGLGSLVGLSGNAIFAPVQEAALRSGSTSAVVGGMGGSSWTLVAGVGVFLLGLVALFPWLAYVEERTFREGLEDAGLGRQVWTALRFGLLHLVMLIPLSAALAIGVAGFAYGLAYRAAYRRAAARQPAWAAALAPSREQTADPPPDVQSPRAEAVMTSTVWHATFNSCVALVVLAALVLDAAL